MSKKCRAYSESKLGLEPTDNRKAFYAGWDAALAQQAEPVSADAHTTTLRNLLECCLSWEPDACVLGNVTARQAIAALKAALAQQDEPVQEPVAWIQPDHLQKARIAPFLCRVEPTQRCADFVPLYLAPPQRKPLTDEEIGRICDAHWSLRQLARAVERAHGIKE